MQVHAGSTAHKGELPVHASSGGTVTTPYAVIGFSPAFSVSLQSAEDCDRATRAVARAKAMLARIGTPHPFTPMAGNRGHCDVCGDLDDKDHWRPEPEGLEDAAAQDEDEADDPFMKATPMQDPAPVVRVLDSPAQCPAGLLREGEDWGAACQKDAGHEPPHDGQDGDWTDGHPRHLPDISAHEWPRAAPEAAPDVCVWTRKISTGVRTHRWVPAAELDAYLAEADADPDREVERPGFIAADSPVLRGARIGGGQ